MSCRTWNLSPLKKTQKKNYIKVYMDIIFYPMPVCPSARQSVHPSVCPSVPSSARPSARASVLSTARPSIRSSFRPGPNTCSTKQKKSGPPKMKGFKSCDDSQKFVDGDMLGRVWFKLLHDVTWIIWFWWLDHANRIHCLTVDVYRFHFVSSIRLWLQGLKLGRFAHDITFQHELCCSVSVCYTS